MSLVNITYDDVYKYLSKTEYNNKNLIKYKNYTKKAELYKNPSSNLQIKTIIEKGEIKDYYKLGQLILKFTYNKNIRNVFLKINYVLDASHNLTDTKIFDFLYDKIGFGKGNYDDKMAAINFAEMYGMHIQNIIINKYNYTITNYLDIGCGNCMKTKLIGDKLQLKRENINGIDIKEWSNYNSDTRNKEINFTYFNDDNTMTYSDNSFDLISAFMVLHHVEKLDILIKEIVRCLKPNGYFIIREHDAYNIIDSMLIDLEHRIHDYDFVNKKEKYNNYAKYYNWFEWDIILKRFGLENVYSNYDTSSLVYEIGPTRYYCSVYRKI